MAQSQEVIAHLDHLRNKRGGSAYPIEVSKSEDDKCKNLNMSNPKSPVRIHISHNEKE